MIGEALVCSVAHFYGINAPKWLISTLDLDGTEHGTGKNYSSQAGTNWLQHTPGRKRVLYVISGQCP